MKLSSGPIITRRMFKVWVLLAFVISYVDLCSAYVIWRWYGRPDFYFRAGGSAAFLAVFCTPWWVFIVSAVLAVLMLTGLSSGHLSLGRFVAIVVLVALGFTAFHLYEFQVHRLIRNGLASGYVGLVVVLVEGVARLASGRQAGAMDVPDRGAELEA